MQPLVHLLNPSDYSAVGMYRLIFPSICAKTTNHNLKFIESSYYIGDMNFYKVCRTVKFQRPYSKPQFNFFNKIVKPCSEMYGFWTIMDIDDCLVYDDIPNYNLAKDVFKGEIQDILKAMMESVDFITTTTDYLADYYANKFGVDRSKFVVIPNYLPRWWIGKRHMVQESVYHFQENLKNKLKVAFICGQNHYDVKNQNSGIDDFTHLIDWVKSSLDIYEFHFVGGVPKQLEQELVDDKIFVDPPVDIMNYPNEIASRNYNIWVCPLQDNVFNRCKSNIKLLEAWSMGIPVFVQDIECYNKFTSNLFTTADDLENKISEIRSKPTLLVDQLKLGMKNIDIGDHNAPNGWWLEKNMAKHYEFFAIPQKTMKIDMRMVDSSKIQGD